MFRIIEKHSRKILIIWLIIALSCSPAAYYITKRSSSTELSFLPKTEAWNALELLNEKFPDHGKSSFIITLSGENITTEDHIKDVVTDITSFTEDKSRFPEIIRAYSVYTLLEQINTLYNESLNQINEYLQELVPNLISESYLQLYQANITLKNIAEMYKLGKQMFIDEDSIRGAIQDAIESMPPKST